MSSATTNPQPREDIAPPREDIAHARDVIYQLIAYAHAKARTLHDTALGQPGPRLPASRFAALARAFVRVARTVRRAILLVEQLALILAHNIPLPAPRPRPARETPERPESVERCETVEHLDLVEQLESVERAERPYNLRTHTLAQIIARIRRELGLKPGEGPTYNPTTHPPTLDPPEPPPQTPEPRRPPGEPRPPIPTPGNAAPPPAPNPEPDG